MKIPGALGHLIEKIRGRFGLDYSGSRFDVLSAALARVDPDIESAASRLLGAGSELVEFVGTITNTETYFFRHSEQFSALGVLIQRQWAHHPVAAYRTWCAGCSTGEEPLTISAVLDDACTLTPQPPFATVLATDINPNALALAQKARYSEWSFRGVLAEQRERYFVRDGAHHRPRPSLTDRISFRRHNLLDNPPEPVPFDLVICRNVLIYFNGEEFERAVNRLAEAVAPGGILVLGPVESAAARLPDFDTLHPGACIIYRKRHAWLEPYVPRGWSTAAAAGAKPSTPRPVLPTPSRPAPPPRLSPTRPAAPRAAPAPAPVVATGDLATRLAHALALADQGRMDEARAAAGVLRAEFGERAELRILSAMILLEEDRRDEAADELQLVASTRPDLAMAHYLLGSILDSGGARALAEQSYRRALLALEQNPPLDPVIGGGGLTVADLTATLTHVLGSPSREARR